MQHLSEGTLRRIYDEPLALTAIDQGHYESCAECKARFEHIANAARATTSLLDVPEFNPEAASAFRNLRLRIAREEAANPPRWYERWLTRTSPRLRPLATPAVALLLAIALVTGVAVTGLGGQLVRVFQPHQFVAVQVSPSDVATSNVLLDYGQVKWLPEPPKLQQVSDAATARTLSGLPVLTPASLPNGVTGAVSYGVISHATGSLTLDAATLQASAAKAGVRVSPMPSSINGSTLIVNGGPALLEVWGLSPNQTEMQMPTLVILQTRVPTVDSTGATTAQLEAYLLSQPGVPPEIAAQIKAIQDPSTTLPIPIPKGMATTQPVQINGVQGLLIKAALGAGVVWEENDVIYAVGGQVTPDQVLAIATSLH